MTNSHDDLHKIVTQKEKDRTISNAVEVIQTIATDLKSQVTQLEKDRTVTNAIAANLKAQVTQLEKDRTVTNAIAANLKSEVTQLEKDRLIIDEEANILDLVKENDNFNAAKHGMPIYAGDDSAPTRKWRAIRCDDHGRQETHLSNFDHDEQFDFRNKDFDTGVGMEKTSLVGLALPSDGGAVIGGTNANPVTVAQKEKDRTVTNAVAANLKSEVTQIAKDRTVTGIVTAKKGQMDYTTIKKFISMPGNEVGIPLWTPESGKKIVLTDLIISADAAGAVTIFCADEELFRLWLSANQPIPIHLESHFTLTNVDDTIVVDGELAVDTEICISAYGYEV